jgi:hypothetical protein
MIAATVIFPPTHPVRGHFAPIAAYRASHALAEFRLWRVDHCTAQKACGEAAID